MLVIVLARTLTLPAANASSPTFAAVTEGYWSYGMVGGFLHVMWSAPFAIDACANDTTSVINTDNFTECSSSGAAIAQLNQTSGNMTFSVPNESASLVFYAYSPRGLSGFVSYTFWVNSSTGQMLTAYLHSGVTLPLGQLGPPYVWANLSVPLPDGYNAITIVGNASQPVSISFNLNWYYIGEWQPVRTSWNVTGYYPTPPPLNITIMALAPVSTTVYLGAVAYMT